MWRHTGRRSGSRNLGGKQQSTNTKKYENVVWLAFQRTFYSKTRLDGHITIRKKSVLRSKRPGEGTTTGGCGPCNEPKCRWCTRINKTSTFTGTQEDRIFDIYHVVNCQSTGVIYIIECNICNLQYVGKSETGFNTRLNNHRNHIKKAFCSCKITEHLTLELITLTMTSPLQLSSK